MAQFFKNLFSGGDERGENRYRQRYNLDDSVKIMLNKIKAQRRMYADEYKENRAGERIGNCVSLQRRQKEARLSRECDDAIFRAYHAENGIRYKLQGFVDFTDVQMRDMYDINTIFLIAYNGNLDMAAFQTRKLETELQELQNRQAEPSSKDSIKRLMGWKDFEQDLARIEKALFDILDDTQSAESDKSALDRRARIISSEIETLMPNPRELMPEAVGNFRRLEDMERALAKIPDTYSKENDELLNALREHLSEEGLKPVSSTDGIGPDEYKKSLSEFADKIQAAVLDRWPRL